MYNTFHCFQSLSYNKKYPHVGLVLATGNFEQYTFKIFSAQLPPNLTEMCMKPFNKDHN